MSYNSEQILVPVIEHPTSRDRQAWTKSAPLVWMVVMGSTVPLNFASLCGVWFWFTLKKNSFFISLNI
jgi:hypothetical protein